MRSKFSQTYRGFTLIELLVSIAIIAVLITLVTISVGRAMRTAKGAADRQTVAAMNQGVQAFKQEFGFLPPLALHDDAATNGIPPVARWKTEDGVPNQYTASAGNGYFVNAYGSDLSWNYNKPGVPYWTSNYMNSQGYLANGNYVPGYLEGFRGISATGPNLSADFRTTDGPNIVADRRFSDYSLAFYLVGALPGFTGTGANKVLVDGVDGPGMFAPNANGTFEASIAQKSGRARELARQGKTYPPFVDTSRNSPRLFTDLATVAGDPAFITRYKLLSPAGKAYRYYRWQPQDARDPHGKSVAAYQKYNADGQSVAEDDFDRLRVPSLVGNPRDNADLRSAEYAIVSCGPDGFFGDMPIEANSDADLASMMGALGVKAGSTPLATTRAAREAARKDNIVEVGR